MSHKDRILGLLRRARQQHRGVCATAFLQMFIPRAAARVHDLRAEGYVIDTVKCEQHTHLNRQVEYRLVSEPGEGDPGPGYLNDPDWTPPKVAAHQRVVLDPYDAQTPLQLAERGTQEGDWGEGE